MTVNKIYSKTSTKVVSQSYVSNVWEEHVIRGNSAIMKCHLPAFVGDFVSIESWLDGDFKIEKNNDYGRYFNRGKIENNWKA